MARPSPTRLLLRGLSLSVTGNAQAFGFSITVTVTFGVISSTHGNPSMLELVGFALSGVAAFSLLNLLVVRLLRVDIDRADTESARALLIATATDFLAVGAGVGAAIAVGHLVRGWGAWVLAPLCAGVVYVVVQSVELAVGQAEADSGAGSGPD